MIAKFDYNGWGEAFLTIGDQEWNEEQATEIGLRNLGLPAGTDPHSDLALAGKFAGWRNLVATHPVTHIEDPESHEETMTKGDYLNFMDEHIQDLLQ
ncbi:MAG: hypothetical protein GTO63_16555 [Anaerolineae bacterium]|nr:hypothetical protein [Anaerolineae bacterium]NIN96422.1 hypothetical protein [Anaerolineae bacterium]NIQ79458.1 hypothetical protein [Anaerolineae bacterium]